MHTKRLGWAALGLAGALALSACGGGGSNSGSGDVKQDTSQASGTLVVELFDGPRQIAAHVAAVYAGPRGTTTAKLSLTGLGPISLWSPDSPKLYTVRATLASLAGDTLTRRIFSIFGWSAAGAAAALFVFVLVAGARRRMPVPRLMLLLCVTILRW